MQQQILLGSCEPTLNKISIKSACTVQLACLFLTTVSINHTFAYLNKSDVIVQSESAVIFMQYYVFYP